MRGEGPSVVIDGVVIPVINGTGDPNLDGTPTAIGLYLLTKCGTAIPPIEMVIPCASMPRMSVYLRTATHEIFTIWFTSDNVVFC